MKGRGTSECMCSTGETGESGADCKNTVGKTPKKTDMDLDRPASTLGGVHPLLQPGVNRFHVCLHCGTHCSHHLIGLHGCESNSRGTWRQNITYAEGGNYFHSRKAKNQCRRVETDKCPELKTWWSLCRGPKVPPASLGGGHP